MAYDFPTGTAAIGDLYPVSVVTGEPQWIYLGSLQWKKVIPAGAYPMAYFFQMMPNFLYDGPSDYIFTKV